MLFLLFQSTAGEVIPTHLKLAGKLLDKEGDMVLESLKKEVKGKYAVLSSDGWKDASHDSITGVGLSVAGKVQSQNSIESPQKMKCLLFPSH